MKKFIKISLALASFFAVVGVFCMIAAFAMGMDWSQLKEMVRNGELSIGQEDFDEHSSGHHEHETCSNLEIELLAGELIIIYDDVEEIEVQQEGVADFSSKMDGHTLKIQGGKKGITNSTKGYVTLTIPKGYVFDEIDMKLGAGRITAELVGDESDYNYDVECGIGEIEIGGNSYGGLGRDTHIENPGAERELDIECGVGQIIIEFQE